MIALILCRDRRLQYSNKTIVAKERIERRKYWSETLDWNEARAKLMMHVAQDSTANQLLYILGGRPQFA